VSSQSEFTAGYSASSEAELFLGSIDIFSGVDWILAESGRRHVEKTTLVVGMMVIAKNSFE
jgi:hypothetical protein